LQFSLNISITVTAFESSRKSTTTVVLGIMNGNNKIGRPKESWLATSGLAHLRIFILRYTNVLIIIIIIFFNPR